MPIDHPPRPPYNDPSQSPPPHDQHGIAMAKKPTPQPPKDITIPLKVLNPWVEFTDAIFHCPEESKEKGGITISVHITSNLYVRLEKASANSGETIETLIADILEQNVPH